MINIVKIGGNVIDSEEALDKFLSVFSAMQGDKILVHGGGKIATTISKELGIETQMINGRRVTDKNTLDVVTMVYAGLINKTIVANLQSKNCNAIGLSGADGRVITAQKRSPIPVDYGFVGDIAVEKMNTQLISILLKEQYTPIFSAITYDGYQGVLNCNADSIASSLAVALSKHADVNLIYCFEKKGVLENVDNPNSVISLITDENYATLKNRNIVSEGMLPKIDNALNAIKSGVKMVIIKSAEDLLNTNAGTTIK